MAYRPENLHGRFIAELVQPRVYKLAYSTLEGEKLHKALERVYAEAAEKLRERAPALSETQAAKMVRSEGALEEISVLRRFSYMCRLTRWFKFKVMRLVKPRKRP